MRSINRTIAYAERHGVSTELLIVLDRANADTRRFVASSPLIDWAKTTLFSADCGDCGLARNVAVPSARGEYISILDGDDLYSENWLVEAHKVNRTGRHYVVHPEVNLYFDQRQTLFYHPDQRRDGFNEANLLIENYWTSLSFSRRDTYVQFPYVGCPPSSGFGYEDWHWNCDLMARGLVHTIAPRTAHFIRVKQTGSLNAMSASRRALIRHSTLFDDFPRSVRQQGVSANAA
jgi:glycosyltransferase involved in cell wall biosynthesis